MLHEEHESPCLDCPAPSPCSHLMGMCPLLSSSNPPLPTEDWKLPRSHLSDPLACASSPSMDGHLACLGSGLVPLGQTQNLRELRGSLRCACCIFWHSEASLKLPSGGLLALMSFSFSLCLFAQVCPLPPMVSHGDYICHPRPCERYNHGTVVEFYCDPGYTLTNDYKYITCQYGEWFPSYQVYCVKTGKG